MDRCAMENFGIPGIVLMENAGNATVSWMRSAFGPLAKRTVPIFTGPGNNGGDGLVIARHVLQRGGFPLIFSLIRPEQYTGDAAINAKIVQKLAIPWQELFQVEDCTAVTQVITTAHARHPVHCLVDALFGTGLSRQLTGVFLNIINMINALHAEYGWPVTAVDIPSGLQGDTGQIMGDAVRADLTVTFGLPQPAHWLHGGPLCGRVAVADIAIPPQAVAAIAPRGSLLDGSLATILRPREKNTHKGSFGHLAILAGIRGKTGASLLAAQGALHGGCGLCSLLVCAELQALLATTLTEAMTTILPHGTESPGPDDFDFIMEQCHQRSALVAGPGLGAGKAAAELLLRLYCELPIPMVVDADGLNILAAHHEWLATPGGPRILTPHPGEMARLNKTTSQEVQADRIGSCSTFFAAHGHDDLFLVLKGAGTVLMASDGRFAINTSGNPGMASGGMGDVLAGCIGSLLCQGYDPWHASCLGVYLHGAAADLLQSRQGTGYLASEVAAALPEALRQLTAAGNKGLVIQ